MNRIMKYISCMGLFLLTFTLHSCSEDTLEGASSEKGTLLNLYVDTGATTRLAELPNTDAINTDAKGKQYIGLYIYYQDDYKAGILSKPYIRNLKCKVDNGKIVPVDVNNQNIYIYDRMTIVAFYPYNESVPDFEKLEDEKQYPITESNYENQTYIPYKTVPIDVNPTDAYYKELWLVPQQTAKIQVVLVSKDGTKFPEVKDGTFKSGEIKMVPSIDPYTTSAYTPGVDRRETWVDKKEDLTSDGTGSNVQRYNAYIWKSGENDSHHDSYKHNDNTIKKGDILFQSAELTLLAPETVTLEEGKVYRYGYNLDTGEIFIPTSERLVYDATSLAKGANSTSYNAYQVCDIDMKGKDWTPANLLNSTYDGGGHAIKNLTMDKTAAAASPAGNQNYGLFGSVAGSSTVKNVNLVDPVVIVDFTTASNDTCNVGALCGVMNPKLTDEQIKALLNGNFPPDLSETVKAALLEEMIKTFQNATSTTQGCKVDNPTITVTGNHVRAGGLCGVSGYSDEQESVIKDSYVNNKGAIKVNENTDVVTKGYTDVLVGGFCGVVKTGGSVSNSFSALSADNVVGNTKVTVTGTPPTYKAQDLAQNFCNVKGTGTVSDCYYEGVAKANVTSPAGTTKFNPGWPSSWAMFGGTSNGKEKWPTLTWNNNSWIDLGSSPSTYPKLMWEDQFIVENN